MRVSTVLLLALLSLLVLVSVSGFNPHDEDSEESGFGATPASSTISCVVDPTTGEEKCESLSHLNVPDEEELAAKVEAAEAAKAAEAEEKARARAERNARLDADKAARRAARDAKNNPADSKEKDASNKQQEKKHKDLYEKSKLAEPIKRMKMSYYKFFGVEQDAPKLRIRSIANNLALANHPDKCPDRDDEKCIAERKEKMIIINEAREVLLSDEKRPKYDFLLNFGFKVYDAALYEDVRKDYDAGVEIRGGWGADAGYNPASDPYESMHLSEESAGWLLLLTGTVTLALMAWPVFKFARKSLSDSQRKEAQRRGLAESLLRNKKATETLVSLKKKPSEKLTAAEKQEIAAKKAAAEAAEAAAAAQKAAAAAAAAAAQKAAAAAAASPKASSSQKAKAAAPAASPKAKAAPSQPKVIPPPATKASKKA